MKRERVALTIEWFDKKRRHLVGEEELVNYTASNLCEILSLDPKDYPFTGGCYSFSIEQGKLIQPLIKHIFDYDKYFYTIGEYTVKQPCSQES